MIRRSLPGLLALAGVVAALATIAIAAADTDLPWSVLGSGGGTASSTNYTLGGTAGQPVAGPAQSANYGLNAGYWYVADTDADGLFDEIDLEDDGDGYTDAAEAGAPLCAGTANEDGAPVNDDTAVNDGCPAVGRAEDVGIGQCSGSTDDDLDGRVNDGCPQAGTYSEAQFKIGTGSLDPCGNNGWPSDLDNQPLSLNKLDIFDIASFIAPRRLDKNPGQAGFDARWDLSPGPAPFTNFINIVDVTTLLSGPAGSPAYPPMFAGLRAYGRVCPFGP